MGLLTDQARAIASGERSSVDTVEAAIETAERLQPHLNAFTGIYREEALAEAREADAAFGDRTGALHGVPVAVKDLYDVAGKVTSGCSQPFLDSPPAFADAPEVAALRKAGAIVIGKTNMHELAFGATNTSSCYGPANNPWDPERIPGGSSGGSGAAVGARIVGLALGSDTGGSIRMPAAFCGATGLKTTWGLLPVAGLMPMAPSFDTAGPIANDAADIALAFDVLTGSDPLQLPPVHGALRIGVARGSYFDVVTDEVGAAFDELAAHLSKSGSSVTDAELPYMESAHEAWLPVALAEFARAYRGLEARSGELDPTIAITLAAAIGLPAEDERRGWEAIVEARRLFASTMESYDVLLLPATPFTAPRHTDQLVTVSGVDLAIHLGGPSRYTRPISTLPSAVLVVPIGAGEGGLPIGAQLVGKARSERLLIALGEAIQRDTDWHLRVPPLHA
jgi:aspartyl-tRNA(Asn)/glutamyl-tRNA(Gln) amidotransferase subunit A